VRADLVQAEEKEDERVRNARKGELPIGERDEGDEADDQRVFERPVVPVPRIDRERDPDGSEKDGESEEVASMPGDAVDLYFEPLPWCPRCCCFNALLAVTVAWHAADPGS
jgi:hypothetical protein